MEGTHFLDLLWGESEVLGGSGLREWVNSGHTWALVWLVKVREIYLLSPPEPFKWSLPLVEALMSKEVEAEISE